MKRTVQQRERERLQGDAIALANELADREWTLNAIEWHLRAHFAAEAHWQHWNDLHHLGALTGTETGRDDGRYNLCTVRNLRHHRCALHLELRGLRAQLSVVLHNLESLKVTLPGFEHVDAEREAAQLTHQHTQPIASSSGAKAAPLFDQTTQGSLF